MTTTESVHAAKVAETLRAFLLNNFLFGDAERMPLPGDSFLEKGIVDSTGILELIEFLENEFNISISERETIPENLDGIDKIINFVTKKTSEL